MIERRPIIRRHAVRALLVARPENQVLLIHNHFPHSGEHVWLTPGGGRERKESEAAALRREVYEETGLRTFHLGPAVWKRQTAFNFHGRRYLQFETFYIVNTMLFEPTMANNPASFETDIFQAFRWWSPEEIMHSDEQFAPRQFGHLLSRLLLDGPPRGTINVGR